MRCYNRVCCIVARRQSQGPPQAPALRKTRLLRNHAFLFRAVSPGLQVPTHKLYYTHSNRPPSVAWYRLCYNPRPSSRGPAAARSIGPRALSRPVRGRPRGANGGRALYAGRAWPPPGPRRPALVVLAAVLPLCWPVGAGPGSGHTRPAITDAVARARQKRPVRPPPPGPVWRSFPAVLGTGYRACVEVCGRSPARPALRAGRSRRLIPCRPFPFVPSAREVCARSILQVAVAAAPPTPVFGCPGLSWRSGRGLLGTCCRASAWAAISRPPPSAQLGRGRDRSQPRHMDS